MARQRHREPPRCPRRKSLNSLIDSQVVKTTPSVMHKCQAVIVGPQDHEIELIVAILEIVNTPPGDTSPSAPRARAGAVRLRTACRKRGASAQNLARALEEQRTARPLQALSAMIGSNCSPLLTEKLERLSNRVCIGNLWYTLG